VHTSNRGAGTGIVDQFLDDRGLTGLAVLMGGGRKWFLPAATPGSARSERNDYAFSAIDVHTAEIVRRWGAAPGAIDKERDLIGDFQRAGFAYAPDRSTLAALDASQAERLLGLFAWSMTTAFPTSRCSTRWPPRRSRCWAARRKASC
jgi:alkaline phosphatase